MKLPDWIHQNRAAFDQAEAPEGLWKEISTAVPHAKRNYKPWLWSAAAALLIAGFAWWLQPQKRELPLAPQLPESFLAQERDYLHDLQHMEAHMPLSELATEPDYQWVFEELAELELINQQYRSDLDALTPREELLPVLIDYYEKRLRLLQRLQMEVERNQKHPENENINL